MRLPRCAKAARRCPQMSHAKSVASRNMWRETMLKHARWPVAAIAVAPLLLPSLASAAAPAAYPTKPIRFVVTFAAGGGTDIFARAIAQKFTEAWGEPVIVDNRAGGNGNIGTDMVAKAPPDGYTILLTTNARSEERRVGKGGSPRRTTSNY